VIGNQVGGQVLEKFALDEAVGAETFDWFAVWGVGAGIIIAVMLLFVLAFRESETLEQEARA